MYMSINTCTCSHIVATSVVQKNEIDLRALLLMSENDFAEVDIPKVCYYNTVLYVCMLYMYVRQLVHVLP